jgi:hypothetical protein
MNQRIKELAKQAGLKQTKWADAETGVEPVRIWQESLNDPGALERFAQLIITECANIANDNYNKGFCPVGGFIEDHFKAVFREF